MHTRPLLGMDQSSGASSPGRHTPGHVPGFGFRTHVDRSEEREGSDGLGQAFLDGRGYVTPQDIKTIGYDVLRHRVIITYEAEAEDLTSEDLLKRIFDQLPVP